MEKRAPRQTGNPRDEAPEPGLTALEAAARLGVNERTIRRAIARGDLAAVKSGGLFRISLDALEQFRRHRLGPGDQGEVEAPQPIRPAPAPPTLVVVGPDQLAPTPLRQPLDTLVGRDAEIAELDHLLRRPDVRLLTLTGPGGVGKTRLALAAAARLDEAFADGVAFVPLAAITDPALVLPTIAQVLGLHDAGDRPVHEGIGAGLRHRELLLILDNFEQVVGSSPVVAELLSACPKVTVLATSREALRVSGESRYPVAPLATPDLASTTATEVDGFAAVSLFLERARRVRAGFSLTAENAKAVATICARLDGLPLAIEMAAAWLGILSPEALLQRLEYRLPLLTGGSRDLPERQRTMRDAVAWSYELLAPEEQRCFRLLAVFVGGFSLSAAEALGDRIAAFRHARGEGEQRRDGEFSSADTRRPASSITLELVASLVEKSLLVQDAASGGEPRFMMLETVREFGLERLTASDEAETAREAHASWCLELALEAGPRVMDEDQVVWLGRLERDHDNLRAAMAWAYQSRDEATGLAMVAALWEFWYIRGHVAEGLRWLDQALSLDRDEPTTDRVLALIGAGQLAHYHGETTRATSYLDQAVVMSRKLGDVAGTALALLELGIMAEDRGDYDAATAHLEESRQLFAGLPASTSLGMTIYHLAVVAYGRGDLELAVALSEEALGVARATGSAFGIAAVQTQYGLIACDRGDSPGALAALREGASLYAASKDLEGIARCLANYAVIAATRRRWQPAARLLGAVETLKEVIGYGFAHPEGPRYRQAEEETRRALGPAFASLVATGRAWAIDEALAEAFALEQAPAQDAVASDGRNPYGLTSREREVLRLIASGVSDREIADALYISRHTAMSHVANILAKLGVNSRTAAAAQAIRDGLA